MTNVYNLRVPMPIPRTRDAPHFNGRYIGDFLNRIVQHGAYAGITNTDELVNYIVEYSSDKVKDLILYMAEFDPEVQGKTWKEAKAALYSLYGTIDKPKEYTEEEMISFCREQSAKSTFVKTSEIESYYRAFIPIAASLKKQGLITDNQFNLYFVKGLPGSMKDWFASAIPQVNRTKYNPPTVAVTLATLKAKFDKDSVIYEDWKHADEDNAKSDFDNIGNRVTGPTFQEEIGIEPPNPGSSAVMPTQDNVQRKFNNVEDLARKLDALTLAVQNQRAPLRQNQGSDSMPPRCFMCGQSGVHPLGIRFCPETNTLISERLLTFNAQRNRKYADSRPSASSAKYGSSEYGGFDVWRLGGAQWKIPIRPVAPRPAPNPNSQLPPQTIQYPQTQPHKEVRFDTGPTPTPSKDNIPQPPNPINNERGWKGSRPGNPRGGNQDVEMKDGDVRKGNNGPQYHFTSKLQEYADPDKMFSNIGDMKVEVPLFQLLGLSPQLSKRFAEGTRTRREYGAPTTSSAELFPFPSDSGYEGDREALASIVGTRGPALTERRVFVEKEDPNLEEFVFRCSNAAAQIPQTRFFAMTVGDVKLTINGTEFLAMIDSGSELNVGSYDIPEKGSLPMDFDGMKWKLKGINGDFEQLRGCVLDAKMRIGGHDFSHHIFISRQLLGRHDIILGQPFLQWFSARLDYERGKHVKLVLWADGNRASRPTLMISITDPEDPRNTTTIRGSMDSRPTSSSSYIEEMEDEDFRR
ncbi:hypothetical protein F5050DRAFT_1812816 [Lentinula boryana]|uniref:DUF4100 domain-containing protein n=1 Tax=Lentinula boryana TaxID=40481 RepID=A0ABQ8PYE3_9AGAR|nr:hypothetical protein F5050DRAFT_1812816 [Lentinula boryana]